MTVVTLIPYFLRSSMIAWVKPTNPNLLALYAAPFSKKFAPARLAIVTIYPFDFFRASRLAFTLLKTPVRFVSMVDFQSASLMLSIGEKYPTPALAINTSRSPKWSTTILADLISDAREVTSDSIANIREGSLVI